MDGYWYLDLDGRLVVRYHETAQAHLVTCQISRYLGVSLVFLVRDHGVLGLLCGYL